MLKGPYGQEDELSALGETWRSAVAQRGSTAEPGSLTCWPVAVASKSGSSVVPVILILDQRIKASRCLGVLCVWARSHQQQATTTNAARLPLLYTSATMVHVANSQPCPSPLVPLGTSARSIDWCGLGCPDGGPRDGASAGSVSGEVNRRSGYLGHGAGKA